MTSASTAKDRHPTVDWKSPASAIRHPSAHLILWSVAVVGLAADLWTKAWAFRELEPGGVRELIPRLLDARLSLNSGALFGMGEGMVPVFIIASIAAFGFVLYLFASSGRRQRGVHVALGLIIAGAFGNLYDRTFVRYDLVRVRTADGNGEFTIIGDVIERNEDTIRVAPFGQSARTLHRDDLAGEIKTAGVVRDFLRFTPEVAGRSVWPWVFNIADALLVAGVFLLLISYWTEARRLHREAATEPAEEPSAG